jgi:transcriptional regulator with XRE-family HTH domain
MTLANGLFAQVLDYLYKEGLVADQQELSAKTGITETTISRILNDRVRQPSKETWLKLNAAFGNIFNPQYFRGESIVMLVADLEHKHVDMAAEDEPKPFIPSWADAFFDVMTQQIKQNEALNRELRKSIAEVIALTQQLTELVKAIKK